MHTYVEKFDRIEGESDRLHVGRRTGFIMKFFEFIFFSMLEYLSFFYFILVLFRFNIKENVLKFVIFSVVLSLVSNTFQTESLQAISPLIQAAFMIFFVVFFLTWIRNVDNSSLWISR